MEVLGPVTYTVETDDGNRCKCHADQIKDWLSSVPQVTSATGNDQQENGGFDLTMDSLHPELNDAEMLETDDHVSEGTSEANW